MILRYRSFAELGDLAVGDCTIHRAKRDDAGPRFWNFWFYVERETDRQPELFCVPVAPGGPFTENGPGGRTWGLNRAGKLWQISPSINVLDNDGARAILAGIPVPAASRSLWHQTPAIEGVSDAETWTTGGPP